MLKKVSDQISEDLQGLDTSFDIIGIGPKKSPNCMNVKFNLDGSIEKRLGSTSQNSVAVSGANTATFYDFSLDNGASLAQNLRAYWKLDELSGTRDDFVGSSDLTDVNSVSYGVGIIQNAANFQANSSFLYTADSSATSGASKNFSISSWVYLNSFGVTQSIVSKGAVWEADSSTVILYHFEPSFGYYDTASNHALNCRYNILNLTNNCLRPISKFGNTSFYPGLIGDVRVEKSPAFVIGGDFCVETWVYLDTVMAGKRQTIFYTADSGRTSFQLVYEHNSGIGVLVGTSPITYFADTLTVSTYSHIAVTKSSGSMRIFRDGSVKSVVGGTATWAQNGSFACFTNGFIIGSSLFGYVDEVRVSRAHRYITPFAVATTAWTIGADTSTVLLLHFDGKINQTSIDYDSCGNKILASPPVGFGLQSGNKKFGSFAYVMSSYSVSVSHNIEITPKNNTFSSGTDFTFEFWYANSFGMQDSSNTTLLSNKLGVTSDVAMIKRNSNNKLSFTYPAGLSGNSTYIFGTWANSANQFYHIAFTKSGSTVRAFIDGVQSGTDAAVGAGAFAYSSLLIGHGGITSMPVGSGGIYDEFRVSNIPRYVAGFSTANQAAFASETPLNFEYNLFVNTDNYATFRVSSSGTSYDATVQATSYGVLTTATWYNVIASLNTSNNISISVNASATNTTAYTGSIAQASSPFIIGDASNSVLYQMNGRVDETGIWSKALISQERTDLYNSGAGDPLGISAVNPFTWGMFDFGASGTRWLAVAAGTGLYASSNMGVTFVTIATDRSATYQSFERSKNVLIATSDVYDRPLYWAGSLGTFAVMLNPSAPVAKYCVNFQGFNILLNTNSRKRGFFYEDENTQLTGDWADAFDFPSSADDEITGAFILRKKLYISLKERIFRVTFVGGNPDWSYLEIKSFGYAPRTVSKVFVEGVGEVILGLTYDRKLRLFDGSEDKLISTDIEESNLCEFSMDNISQSGSGLTVSYSVYDENEQVYKLWTAIGQDSASVTHTINFDGRIKALYPDDNQNYQCGAMANSGNKKYLLAADRSGFVYILNNGNKDYGTLGIKDVYDSPFTFDKSPSQSMKSHTMDMYFQPTSSNKLYLQDRSDFSSVFKPRTTINITDTGGLVQIHKPVDIPNSHNVYQFRLTSSGETLNTAEPWLLTRVEHFTQGQGIGKNGPYQ